MIKFTTDEEYRNQWRGAIQAIQMVNENYMRIHTAQDFTDKLERAQADTLKSCIVRDIENQVFTD